MSLPVYGSFKRPEDPSEGIKELEEGRVVWPGGDLEIEMVTEEFTSICPKTGQPDFYKINVKYVPVGWYIESKTMKFYLWAFRDQGYHCETLTKKICEDLFQAISPESMEVMLTQSPRGGISIISKYKK